MTTNYVKRVDGAIVGIGVEWVANTGTYSDFTLIQTTRGVNYDGTDTTSPVTDLNARANAAVVLHRISAVDFGVSGEGVVHLPDLKQARDWHRSGQPLNVLVTIPGAYTETVSMYLKTMNITAQSHEDATVTFAFVPNSAPVANAIA